MTGIGGSVEGSAAAMPPRISVAVWVLLLLSCALGKEGADKGRKTGIDQYFEELGDPGASAGRPTEAELGSDGRQLREAAAKGDLAGIRRLLEGDLVTRGRLVDVDDRNELGWTALHVACAQGHLDVIDELLAQGASPQQKDSEGHGALHFAVTCPPGWCVDMYAAVEKLLEAGAVADERDHTERTPLHTAASKGHAKACRVLLRKVMDMGKGHEEFLNAVEKDGHSALHLAATAGHVETVKRLLEWGADTSIANKEGKTAQERSKAHDGVQVLFRGHVNGESDDDSVTVGNNRHTRGRERLLREYGEEDPPEREGGDAAEATQQDKGARHIPVEGGGGGKGEEL